MEATITKNHSREVRMSAFIEEQWNSRMPYKQQLYEN
jgi:hypothetical protein